MTHPKDMNLQHDNDGFWMALVISLFAICTGIAGVPAVEATSPGPTLQPGRPDSGHPGLSVYRGED